MSDSDIAWEKLAQDDGQRVSYRTIVTKTFRMPDGRTADYGIMDPVGERFVAVFAVTTTGTVILAKQYRPGPEKICFEVPGGVVDGDETPEEAVRRELQEEIGYEGTLQLIAVTPTDAYRHATQYHYLALNCHKVERTSREDEYEFIELVEVSVAEAEKYLYDGDLTDADTALFALRELEKLQHKTGT